MYKFQLKTGILIPKKYKNEFFYKNIITFLTRKHKIYMKNELVENKFYVENKDNLLIPRYFPLNNFLNPYEYTIENLQNDGKTIDIQSKIILKPEQKQVIEFMNNNDKCILQVFPSFGKCLGKGTKVLMFDGSTKKVEDIVVDDQIMGPDSKPRKILSLSHGREEMFSVTPEKHESYIVNKSHVLSLKNIKTDEIINISVNEYLKESEEFKKNYYGWKTGVKFKEDTNITNDDSFLFGYNLGDNDLFSYIPDKYKFSSIENRNNLLFGILTSLAKKVEVETYIIKQRNKKLTDDILFLSRSLGYISYIENNNIIIKGNINDISLKTVYLNITLKSIGEDEYYGFEIDGDHLFVLGDFTVTHNTVVSIHLICIKRKKTIILVHKDSLAEQWMDRALSFTNISENNICRLNSKTFIEDLKKDIIISTIQTFLSLLHRTTKLFLNHLYSANFGIFIGDEVHMLGAPIFSSSSLFIPTKYNYGLSATPYRYDNNDDIIRFHLGEIYIPKVDNSKRLKSKIIVFLFNFGIPDKTKRYIYMSKKFEISRYLNMLKKASLLHEILLNIINTVYSKNRHIICILERIKLMEILEPQLLKLEYDYVKFITGQNISALQHKLILATAKKMRDGIDISTADSLIMTSPISNIEQILGRILRPDPKKNNPVAFDLVDTGISDIAIKYYNRLEYYKQNNYEIEYYTVSKKSKTKISEDEALEIIKYIK